VKPSFLPTSSTAKKLLEDISGQEVKGYRAPSFSIGEANLWAFDCLARAGYRYSSSIYPIRHDHYGMPDAPRFAHQVRDGLLELPVTTAALFDRNWPASGGGYFRLLPYALSRWLLQKVNQLDGQPAIFYFHPWEIDAEQPRIAGISAKTRFRHYVNLRHTEGRLKRLLADFSWGRMDEVFLGAGSGAGGELMTTTIEEVPGWLRRARHWSSSAWIPPTGRGGALGCLRPRPVRKPPFSTSRDGSGSCARFSAIERISSTPSVRVWSKAFCRWPR
jgi:hypothetical protein